MLSSNFKSLRVNLSKNLSDKTIKSPPIINPIVGISQALYPKSSQSSIAGLSKDQKLAAIITPAPNPSIEFKILFFTSLKKNTTLEPNAVINQVNKVAKRPCSIGLRDKNQIIILSPHKKNL